MQTIRELLRAETTRAMKARDTTARSACRSALAVLDNATAVPTDVRAGALEATALGLGSAEAERRVLTEDEQRALVAAEAAGWRETADSLPSAQAERAAELRAQAQVVERLLGEQ